MKQVTPHRAFPSGRFWIPAVLEADPPELARRFGLRFEAGAGDLGEYQLAAIQDPCAGQLWLFRYDQAPYRGTDLVVDSGVRRDDALFALWSQLGLDVRALAWVNEYEADSILASSVRPEAAKVDRSVTGLAALTPREREVLDLVSAGLTNPEIARELRVSPTTVSAHLRRVSDKLGKRGIVDLRRSLRAMPRSA